MKIRRVAFVSLIIDEAQSVLLSSQNKLSVKFKNKLGIRPKLGLEYLCAALKQKKIDSKIYDQELENFSAQQLISLFKKDGIDLIGFQAVSRNINSIKCFVKIIRGKSDIPIISGGAGCCHFKELIEGGCDIICLGEGEQTIIDIIDYYEGKTSIENVNGCAYYDSAKKTAVVNPFRPQIENLDVIPFPIRTKQNIRDYFDYLLYPLNNPCLTMITSRGCPYRCSYCSSHSFWMGSYRTRSVGNVLEEIKSAVRNFNIRSVQFIDDVFAADFDWLKDFCERLERENLGLKWACYLHPMSFGEKREKAFLLMKRSGCEMISFGAQSANPGVLQRVNRYPQEPQELAKAVFCAKSIGITTVICYIFGLPGETEDTIRENFDYCLRVKPHLVFFNPLDIIPFCDLAKEYDGKEVSKLPKEQVGRLSTAYTRSYYFTTDIAVRIVTDILRKNPLRLIKFAAKSAYFAEKMSYLN